MALTDVTVKALKPLDCRYMRCDGSGLYVEVLPSGEKSWILRYRFRGRPARISLGRYPLMSLREARDERDEMRKLVRCGISPIEQRRQMRRDADSDLTVRRFGDRYFREQVESKWKNPASIRRYLDNEIFPTLGDRQLKDVSALDVQALVYRKRDHGQVAAAVQLRSVMKWIFDYALELQLVSVNPATMVARKFIGKSRRRTRVLSPKEIRCYLRTLYASNIRRQFKLALHIILLTLVRKSELLQARWEHIDFETREWLIPAENSKNGNPHIVFMSRQVSEMFQELRKLAGISELVLPGRGSTKKPFAKNALNKSLEGLTFEMEPFTIHDFRRTGATLLTEKGFNKDVIEKAMSHEAQGIRAVYVLAEYAEERKRMLQWWSDYVDSIATEENVIVGNFARAGNGTA